MKMNRSEAVIKTNATYTGYHVLFEYDNKKYDMKTETGNRGTMTIFLHSINFDDKTYNWSYLHKDDVWTSNFVSIQRDD